ncbi:MAG: T9SS type A sorting domain-containing protein, partial [Bacteroidia bacterium]|nr:T9SS type A sorting domain-containing protein [Bacteroidia bacterium]
HYSIRAGKVRNYSSSCLEKCSIFLFYSSRLSCIYDLNFGDVGWDINEGNIERFFTQINPDSTSLGLFRVRGKITTSSIKYDRFARSFEHSTGKDTMYFKFDPEMFIDSKPKSLNFKIIWLDKNAGSSWSFRYKSAQGMKDAQQVTGIGDNSWKTVSFTITDALLDKSGVYGSDCMLVNTDNTDDIFNSIEVGIERELSTGVVKNTMVNDLNVQVFPNPAGSVLNIHASRPIKYVELYDLNGKVVLRKSEPHNSLDISFLSKGIYFLKTMLDNGMTINKMIKE